MQESQKLDENAVESLLLQYLENAGYTYKSGKDLERVSKELRNKAVKALRFLLCCIL